jgi:hypothetical protein
MTINEQLKPGSRFHDRLVYRWSDRRLIKFLKRRRSLARLDIPTHVGRLIRGARGKLDQLTNRTLPAGIVPYKGWQWWCLTHDCARYVLDYVNANPRVVRFFRPTLVPDESFFHTVIANSEFAHTLSPAGPQGVISGNHYVRWRKIKGRCKPQVLKEGDFDELAASEACFARKFSETKSGRLIERLHDWINDRGR